MLWALLLCEWLSVIVLLALQRRDVIRDAPALSKLACVLCIADTLYEGRPHCIGRYPYNLFVECLYGIALCGVVRICMQGLRRSNRRRLTGWPRRLVDAYRATPVVIGWPVATWTEWHYLVGPLHETQTLGWLAHGVTAAYASLHALAACLLVSVLFCARHVFVLCSWCGLGVLLSGDVESRAVALGQMHHTSGVGTSGWTLGFVVFVFGIAMTPKAPKDAMLFVPIDSVQVVVALMTSSICALFVVISFRQGFVQCGNAQTLGHLVTFFWLAMTAFAALGMMVSSLFQASARTLPRVSCRLATSPAAHTLPQAAMHWFEGRILLRAHRALQRQLMHVVIRARETTARRKRARVVASLLHEWQGPLTALETLVRRRDVRPNADLHTMATLALRRARCIARLAQREGERTMASERRISRDRSLHALSMTQLQGLLLLCKQSAAMRFVGAAARVRVERLRFVDKGEGIVRCRRAGLRACVDALLDNALEASSKGMVTLAIRLRPARSAVDIVVVDEGPGLATNALHAVGTPFLPSQKEGRYGLGLWGVARRLRQWGGMLDVKRRKHRGMMFILRLQKDVNSSETCDDEKGFG